ncbi:MAG TPA: OsmC family protein [Chthonomonadaceae bacterium]|nr:OsmC family protein [Chthonomonadaceae bacterium]
MEEHPPISPAASPERSTAASPEARSRNMHIARTSWRREDAVFTDNRYSRAHTWEFDGGITVAASASPHVVAAPMSSVAAIDPEEALVAAASSCHMLSFLYVAQREGYVVDSYDDDAYGLLERVDRRKLAITRIVLRPRIAFSGDKLPDEAAIVHLHHLAHEECYIANSLKSEISVRTG